VAASEPAQLVVCDAGPLIHLDELRCLDLLNAYTEIYVPGAVWREVQTHRPSAFRRRRVLLQRVEIVPDPTPELVSFIQSYTLDRGEQEAFRLLQQFPEATLLTDDQAARAVAEKMHYPIHGTLGVLVFGLEQGRRTKRQTLNLLRAIPRRTTLHLATDLLQRVIAQVKEYRLD
jgi:predicted nucleic acid-binding protein